MNRLYYLCKKSVMALVALVVASFAVVLFSNVLVSANGEVESFKYVSLGDSMTTGFGYDDYYVNDYDGLCKDENGNKNVRGFLVESENAYPTMVKKLLEEKYSNVELTQLAGNAMRIDDIFGYLADEDEFAKDDFFIRVFDTVDSNKGENWNEYWANRAVALGKVEEQESHFATMKKLFQDSVAQADLVTLNAGYNNFGTFFTGRLGDLTGLQGIEMLPNYGDTDTLQDLLDSIECDITVEEVYQMIRQSVFENTGCDVDEFAELELANGAVTLQVKDFVDLVVHAFVSYCYYMAKTTEKIYELNPDVNLVVLGLANTQVDLVCSYQGHEINLGGVYGYLVEAANLFTRALCPSADKYQYLDVEDLDVELLFDNLKNDTLTSDMYNRLIEELCHKFGFNQTLQQLYGALVNFIPEENLGVVFPTPAFDEAGIKAAFANEEAVTDQKQKKINAEYRKLLVAAMKNAAGLALGDSEAIKSVSGTVFSVLFSLGGIIGEDGSVTSTQSTIAFYSLLLDIFKEASRVESFELEGLLELFDGPSFDVGAIISNAIVGDSIDPAVLGLLNIYIKVVLCNGMWKHPSAKGHEKIANALVELVAPALEGEKVESARDVAVSEFVDAVAYYGPIYYEKYAPYITYAFCSFDGTEEEAKEHLKFIHSLGPDIASLTRGAKGCILYDGNEFFIQPSTPIAIQIDTMGAGDSFITTFMVNYTDLTKKGFSRHDAIAGALQMAADFASKVCEMDGAFGYGIPYED